MPDTLLSRNPIRAHGKPVGMAICAGSASCRMHRGQRAKGKWVPHPGTIYEITRCQCVKRDEGYIQPLRTCRSRPTRGNAATPTSAPSLPTSSRPRTYDQLCIEGIESFLQRSRDNALVGAKASDAARKRSWSGHIGRRHVDRWTDSIARPRH